MVFPAPLMTTIAELGSATRPREEEGPLSAATACRDTCNNDLLAFIKT